MSDARQETVADIVREINGSETAAAIPLAEDVGGVDDDMPF